MRALGSAIALCVLGSLCCFGSGCAHVPPYERESLARVQRNDEAAADTHRYEAHFWSVRGGMAGGTGEPGGGCGCN